MKKHLLLLIACLGSTAALAQSNIFPSTGRVGIGTTAPNNLLELRFTPLSGRSHLSLGNATATSGSSSALLSFAGVGIQNAGFAWVPNTDLSLGRLNLTFGTSDNPGANTAHFAFRSDGSMGIGTTSIIDRLTINGDISLGIGSKGTGYGNYLHFRGSYYASGDPIWMSNYTYDSNLTELRVNLGNDEILDPAKEDKFVVGSTISGVWKPAFGVLPSGRVGIGTTTPTQALDVVGSANISSQVFIGESVGIGTTTIGAAYKLAVNGSIRAKEVRVETGWADFVFAPEYKLPTLAEVEQFIKLNRHLPEIPSEAEVTANGINVGEMNAKLLQKIEELTLYAIGQEKELKTVRQENQQLQSYLQKMEERLEQLEAKQAPGH